MIVVDTNVIAYLFIKGEYSKQAKKVIELDSDWISPILWKSEFRSVLALYIRKGYLSPKDAYSILKEAEYFMESNEYEANSSDILELVNNSNCSAYDCEFVALAQRLDLKLYTSDKQILKNFPGIAVSLSEVE
ncbi:type II toxin-antitoxin system VapC family toxin [Bacteroidota bacterium]